MYNLHQQHKAYQRFNQVQLIFLPNGLILGAVDGSAQLWWRHSCLQKPLSLEQSAAKATLWRCLNRTVGVAAKRSKLVSVRPSCVSRVNLLGSAVSSGEPVNSQPKYQSANWSISVQKQWCTTRACGVNRWHDLDRKNWSTRMQLKLLQLEQRCWFG